MISSIIETVICAFGIWGFFSGHPVLVFAGAAVTLIIMVIGLLSGSLRSIWPYVIGGAAGAFLVKPIKYGICVGLCFESVIMEIVSVTLILLVDSKTKKYREK